MNETSNALDADKKKREDLIQELENFEGKASKKKKEQAKYLKEIAQYEKKISERNNRLDKSVSISVCSLQFSSFWHTCFWLGTF